LSLKPAPPNSGIVFSRTDLNGAYVKAELARIDFSALQLATTLRDGDVVVQTTEHLLSALYGMGIDNCLVTLDGSEVPIMDGSSAPFLALIEKAGIRSQAVARKILKVEKPFHFEWEGKTVSVTPDSGFRISYEIQFDHPMIRRQRKTVAFNRTYYENEIAPARTFGFLQDIDYLKSLGLIKGGSLDNAVVLDGERILNEGLRFNDEFVAHKILDMVGDLAVSGYRFQGHFTAYKAGHETHARFLQAFLEAEDCYSVVIPTRERTVAGAPALINPIPGMI
jgi:UDP-3-O-[3-hydroxymyristoyl] N-acetylglucosamine deacetylase